jgi:hypothetical protein
MAAQAQELAATAEQLKGLVARFKLGDKVSAAATTAGRTAEASAVSPLRRAA